MCIRDSVILVDEINRASPKTQSALLECMEEGQVTVDGETRVLPQPFMIIATQNPVEYEGTFPLPEAQLDRFAVRVAIGYPAPEDEAGMLLDLAGHDALEGVVPVADDTGIVAARRIVERAHTDPSLARYVVGLVGATRRDPRAELGASPRAGLALLRAAKAHAVVDGRGYVVPEDVRVLAQSVLGHRIILTPDARARGALAGEVVADQAQRQQAATADALIEPAPRRRQQGERHRRRGEGPGAPLMGHGHAPGLRRGPRPPGPGARRGTRPRRPR